MARARVRTICEPTGWNAGRRPARALARVVAAREVRAPPAGAPWGHGRRRRCHVARGGGAGGRVHGRVVIRPEDSAARCVSTVPFEVCFVVDNSWSVHADRLVEQVEGLVFGLLEDATHAVIASRSSPSRKAWPRRLSRCGQPRVVSGGEATARDPALRPDTTRARPSRRRAAPSAGAPKRPTLIPSRSWSATGCRTLVAIRR